MFSIKLKRPTYMSLRVYIRMIFWVNISAATPVYSTYSCGMSRRLIRDPDLFVLLPDHKEREVLTDILDEMGEYDAYQRDLDQILGPFRKHLKVNMSYITTPYLRFCPECIKKGRHYIFHQLTFLDSCPVCGADLESRCPACGHPLYERDYRQYQEGFRCKHCGEAFTEFEDPVDLFASYIDDPQTKLNARFEALICKEKAPVFMLATNYLGKDYSFYPQLNDMLLDYYLTGGHPDADIVVPKTIPENSIPKTDIILMMLLQIDRLLQTGYAQAYIRNGHKRYHALSAEIYRDLNRNASIEADAWRQIYYSSVLQQYRGHEKYGHVYLKQGQESIEKQIQEANIDEQMRKILVDRICDDWVTHSHKLISDYLHNKGMRQHGNKLGLPQFVYVCFEEEDAFRICRVFTGWV